MAGEPQADPPDTPPAPQGPAPSARRFFWIAALGEAGLGGLGVLFGFLAGVNPAAGSGWEGYAALTGLAGVSVPWLALDWTLRSRRAAARELREFLQHVAVPLFSSWSIPQLAFVSLLAGLGEELLFRGFLQQWLATLIGAWPALGLASLVFGVCHWITPAYAAVAGAIGLWLGVLYLLTGGLAAPVVAHAAYDLVALVYLTRHWVGPRT